MNEQYFITLDKLENDWLQQEDVQKKEEAKQAALDYEEKGIDKQIFLETLQKLLKEVEQ